MVDVSARAGNPPIIEYERRRGALPSASASSVSPYAPSPTRGWMRLVGDGKEDTAEAPPNLSLTRASRWRNCGRTRVEPKAPAIPRSTGAVAAALRSPGHSMHRTVLDAAWYMAWMPCGQGMSHRRRTSRVAEGAASSALFQSVPGGARSRPRCKPEGNPDE